MADSKMPLGACAGTLPPSWSGLATLENLELGGNALNGETLADVLLQRWVTGSSCLMHSSMRIQYQNHLF